MRQRTVAGCWVLVAGAMAGAAVMLQAAPPSSQKPLFTQTAPASEFAQRRAAVMRAIGDGVAVLQGATERPVYKPFRQSAQFFYLTGVEVPRAMLLIDGRAKTSTLFLPARDERMERSEGPVLTPGADAVTLTVDRPFVFALRDTQTGAVLFLGRITDPSAPGS